MLDIKQTKWVIFDENLEYIWNKGDWTPVSELENLANGKTIKYYRGWKAAINGYMTSCGSTEAVRKDEIRVLPINLTIKIDESYKEVPVSTYFGSKYNVDINHLCRYVKTEKLNAIIDLVDNLNVRLGTHTDRGEDSIYISWKEKDKYGIEHDYCDTIIATAAYLEHLK